MILGFTGTRYGMSNAQLGAFWRWLERDRDFTSLHHGDCVGADLDAHNIASAVGFHIAVHPPLDGTWQAHCEGDRYLPPQEYLKRNRAIVVACDRLIATPREAEEQEKGGTWYTVRFARRVGTPITIIWPDGTTTDE